VDLRSFYDISSAYYDADYEARGYSEDISFYVGLAVEVGGPVLEMGCGTGRILIRTAAAGIEIHGIDSSAAMLTRLREKLAKQPQEVRARVSVGQGDIRASQIGRRFKLVTAPFRVVQHLIEREDQRAWLRNVAAHLEPDGSLVFDVFQPDFDKMREYSKPVIEIDRTDPVTGARVRRIASVVSHAALQTMDVHLKWLVEDRSGKKLEETHGTFLFRWFTRGELENLLELEGYEIVNYWGSFKREPFGEHSEHQIVRVRLRP
jgi:SAM-dependent methyltransferase